MLFTSLLVSRKTQCVEFYSKFKSNYEQTARLVLLAAHVCESNAGPERRFSCQCANYSTNYTGSRLTQMTKGRRSSSSCELMDSFIRIQELGKDMVDMSDAYRML